MRAETLALCLCVFLLAPAAARSESSRAAGEPDCAKALRSGKKDPPALFLRLWCLAERKDYARARGVLAALEGKVPEIEDRLLLYAAAFAREAGEDVRARGLYEKLLREHPRSAARAEAREGLAEILSGSGELEEAKRIYASLARETESRWSKALHLRRLGEILEKQGRTGEALEVFERIWTQHPEVSFSDYVFELSAKNGAEFSPLPRHFLKRGNVFYRSMNWKSALDAFSKAPKTRAVRTKAAICLYRLGRFPEALEAFSAVDSPRAVYWKGKTLQAMGREKDAAAAFAILHRLNPKTPYAPRALLQAGRLRHLRGELEAAAGVYRTVLERYPGTEQARLAVWNLGWIHYRNGEYEKTLGLFSPLRGSRRFAYWRARALEKTGDRRGAREAYRGLAGSSRFTYYSLLAKMRLGRKPPRPAGGSPALPENPFGNDPGVARFLFFRDAGAGALARAEAEALEKRADSAAERVFLAALYGEAGNWYDSIRLSAAGSSPAAARLSFPLGFREHVRRFSRKYGLDEFLVYSLIREESRFDERAVSVSDARGLMQLLPSTAEEVAGKTKTRYSGASRLFVPRVNVEFGCYYVSWLLERFSGNVAVSLAGYNGGPTNAEKWYGDGGLPLDEFVEEIPFEQSRNYVKKVLASYGAYEATYGAGAGQTARQSLEKFLRTARP